MSDKKHVYEAISAVTAAMSREGISKSRKNDQQGYKFRGIDDVYNALSAHLAANKLCILPRVTERTVTERPTKSGGVSTYVVLAVSFDLVSAVDGSLHTISTMGEAMDTADKATNKAMSAAMKYACMMAFQIPTEGDNDADAHHIEPSYEAKRAPVSLKPSPEEEAIEFGYADAMSTDAIAKLDIEAAAAVKSGKISADGRQRLLKARASAIAALEQQKAAS